MAGFEGGDIIADSLKDLYPLTTGLRPANTELLADVRIKRWAYPPVSHEEDRLGDSNTRRDAGRG